MISDTDADVGKHNVWTRILLSPRDEVYSNAAWNATSRESLRSSIRYNASYIDSNVQQGATNLHNADQSNLTKNLSYLTFNRHLHPESSVRIHIRQG